MNKMESGFIFVILAAVTSLAFPADDQSCMSAISDPVAVFGQDNATNSTPIAETKGETTQTCTNKCCQSETCNVVIFRASEQEADSTCQLFSCQPIKSCSFRVEAGVSLFLRHANTTLGTATAVDVDVTTFMSTDTTLGQDTPLYTNTITPQTLDATLSYVTSDSVNISAAVSDTSTASSSVSNTTPLGQDTPLYTNTTTAQTLDATLSYATSDSVNISAAVSDTSTASSSVSNTTPLADNISATHVTSSSAPGNQSLTPEELSTASTNQYVNSSAITQAIVMTTIETFGGATMTMSQLVSDVTNETSTSTSTLSTTVTDSVTGQALTDKTYSDSTTTVSTNSDTRTSISTPLSQSTENTTPLPTRALTSTSTELDTSTLAQVSSTDSNTNLDPNQTEENEVVALTEWPPNNTSTAIITDVTQGIQETSNSDFNSRLNTTRGDSLIEKNSTLTEHKGVYTNSTLKLTGDKDSREAMVVILVCTLTFGCVFLLVVVGILSRRIYEGYQKRHYSRLDYLINGMYY
uniref:Seven cysteines N-terminal domain-containing protein n=2 Tax=Biomphalaria glabrata TaxID=6526 RepID=A0A2C9LKK4_BIOGL